MPDNNTSNSKQSFITPSDDPVFPSSSSAGGSQPSASGSSNQPPAAMTDLILNPNTPQTASGGPIELPTVTSPEAPEKYGGKKVIATIFGVLLLLTSVTAGVYLVQQNANPNRRASSGSECDHAPDCELLDNPGNSGRYTAPRPIKYLYITAREAFRFDPQTTDNGCYRVSINGRDLEWQRYGDGPSCKDISNIQVWVSTDIIPSATPTSQPTNTPTTTPSITPTTEITSTPSVTPKTTLTPTQTPPISAQCSRVTAYNTSWQQLSANDLSALKAGNTVRFTVSGTASSGTIDRAKFVINGTTKETTTKRSGTNDFYVDYLIPQGTTSFTVTAQVHHSELGWF